MKLKEKLSAILIQLPPSLKFEKIIAEEFFKNIRKVYQGNLLLEPRHSSWRSEEAIKLREIYKVSKVLADPEPCKSEEINQTDILYLRLHGSPVIYESKYDKEKLEEIKKFVISQNNKFKEIWIIFDNTTFGLATINAVQIKQMLE